MRWIQHVQGERQRAYCPKRQAYYLEIASCQSDKPGRRQARVIQDWLYDSQKGLIPTDYSPLPMREERTACSNMNLLSDCLLVSRGLR